MFNFFGKKKPAETPTDEPIQGQADATKQNNGDDFIFVERKTDADPPALGGGGGGVGGGLMYPPMPQSAYGPMPYPPAIPARQTMGTGPNGAINAPINYLQDIPFELSPQLKTKDRFSGTQIQVDAILAFLTRQMSVDALADDYTFTLERSVQNDCF